MKINLVEKHIIKENNPIFKQIDELCFKSKNLYNYCNYLIRQEFITNNLMLKEYDLINLLTKERQIDYVSLPAQSSQQVIKLLYKNWKSFFKSCKERKTNPSKFLGRPKLPKYKDKKSGRNVLIFTNQNTRLKSGFIHFPKSINLEPIKTNVENHNQVRLIPSTGAYIIEIIYEKEVKKNENLNSNFYLSIDLGLHNIVTMLDNIGSNKPIIIKGNIIRSINQFFNKKIAFLKSCLKDNKQTSRRIRRLHLKRENIINDHFHKISRFIVEYCLKNNIKNIVVGYNKEWKQKVNLGSKTNQRFVSVPYLKLIEMIKYKSLLNDIIFQTHEESYTSKCDSLALEPIFKQEVYLGKRIKRGLFKSSTGYLLNADVNGTINILRKVIGDGFVQQILANKSCVLQPISLKKEINKNFYHCFTI